MPRELHEQLTKYLTDAHSIEVQALAQLKTAPELAGDAELERAFRDHLSETEGHERVTRELLEARGEKPARLKDAVMGVGGKGFLLFARLQPDTPGKLLAHALSYEGLELGPGIVDDPELAAVFSDHLAETRDHAELVQERLQALGGDPSSLKDALMRLGALNWGAFFQGHPDTPGKLAAFAYAFEHLEIGGYEQLKRVAAQAGDAETVSTAERILGQERAAADRIAGAFDAAVTASLRAVGAVA